MFSLYLISIDRGEHPHPSAVQALLPLAPRDSQDYFGIAACPGRAVPQYQGVVSPARPALTLRALVEVCLSLSLRRPFDSVCGAIRTAACICVSVSQERKKPGVDILWGPRHRLF